MTGSCVIVMTCRSLGMDWLASPFLGLPAGVWMLLAAYATYRLTRPSAEWTAASSDVELTTTEARPANPAAVSAPQSPAGSSVAATVEARSPAWSGALGSLGGPVLDPEPALGPVGRIALRIGDVSARLCRAVGGRGTNAGWITRTLERLGWPDRPLRVGLCVRDELARGIVKAEGVVDVQFVRVPAACGIARTCERLVLDAMLIEDELGHVTLHTPVQARREAGWPDWSSPLPLSYAGAFALRLDPEDVGLGRAGELRAADAPLVRALVEQAAMLARHVGRVDGPSRLAGRRPASTGRDPRVTQRRIDAGWANLGRQASAVATSGRSHDALQAAVRVLSAYMANADGTVDLHARRDGIELALRVLDEEPNVCLRGIAARLATFDDRGATELAIASARRIRARGVQPMADPWAFLISELTHAVPSHFALGRLAAGITLVFAGSPADRLPYLCEDMTEELRRAGWLCDRDSDIAMLVELMKRLASDAQASSSGAPAAEGPRTAAATAA